MIPGVRRFSILEWDSGFFGRKIARLESSWTDGQELTGQTLMALKDGVECLYLLLDASNSGKISLALAAGFAMVDIRITLSRVITPEKSDWTPVSPNIRLANCGDIADLSLIAAKGHTDSRFYSDPGFPDELCDRLYATWIEKSCNGYAEAVLAAVQDGTAAGYTSCHINPDGSGQIGLVGVGDQFQGKGLGKCLIAESLRWFACHGCNRVSVVTQGKNVGAQRLYQKQGFLTESVEIWFHKWL